MLSVDRLDIEGNAHNGPLLRLPFASLFDTLGLYVLFIYKLLSLEVHLFDIFYLVVLFTIAYKFWLVKCLD